MPISTNNDITLEKINAPVEDILYSEENIGCFNKNTNIGSGRLYITNRTIVWLNNDDLGFYLNYQKINMHAISRNINSFPHPCIYVMLESETSNEEVMNNDRDTDEDDENDDDGDDIREIRFVPSNPTTLEDIYNAMSLGNTLNPDPNDSNSDEDDEEYACDEGQGDGGHDLANGNQDNNRGFEEDEIEEGQFDDDVMQS